MQLDKESKQVINSVGHSHKVRVMPIKKHNVKTGVILVNLGSPSAPDTQSVRKYLRQFLSDPRVVEIPKVVWWFILNFIVLMVRPKKSAAAYQKVWTEEGSPLVVYSRGSCRG